MAASPNGSMRWQELRYFPHEDLWHAVTYPDAVVPTALLLSQRWTPDLPEGPHRGAFAEFDDLGRRTPTASRPDTMSITTMSSLQDWLRHLPDVLTTDATR